MSDNIRIFSGVKSKYLAKKIVKSYGTKLNSSTLTTFSDSEFQPSLDESVRGRDVYLIQSLFPPVDNLFELLQMADAAKRASAQCVTAVIPYMGWARQDRKDKPRVPITAKLLAELLQVSGIDKIITVDLHADQIQGFFDISVNHLSANYIFIPYLRNLQLDNMVIASPDVGGTKRAKKFADAFGVDMVICHKHRDKANSIDEMKVIGDVNGKNVIIVDDLIDTAGTVCTASDIFLKNGALSVRAIATHPVLSGPAYERIDESSLTELITTDSIPLNFAVRQELPDAFEKITILSVGDMIGNAIKTIVSNESISSQFEKK